MAGKAVEESSVSSAGSQRPQRKARASTLFNSLLGPPFTMRSQRAEVFPKKEVVLKTLSSASMIGARVSRVDQQGVVPPRTWEAHIESTTGLINLGQQ